MSHIWFIHGTYTHARIVWTQNMKFCQRLAFCLNATYDNTFDWGGGNGDSFRQAGAEKLATRISKWRKSNPYDKIILVGHSHGGNVGILATNLLAEEKIMVHNLITISTPVREYKPAHGNIQIHNNIYNIIDSVQVNGSKELITITDEIKKRVWFESGLAGRKFPNANNIEVPFSAYLKEYNLCLSVIPAVIQTVNWSINAHGLVIQKVNIWRKHVEWRLRK